MTRPQVFRMLMLLYLAAVAVLCFCNFSSIHSIPGAVLNIPTDKVVHFCMFLPFPFVASRCFKSPAASPWRLTLRVSLIFIAGCILAASTELIQEVIPYREMNAGDFFADALGLCVCSLAIFVIDLFRARA